MIKGMFHRFHILFKLLLMYLLLIVGVLVLGQQVLKQLQDYFQSNYYINIDLYQIISGVNIYILLGFLGYVFIILGIYLIDIKGILSHIRVIMAASLEEKKLQDPLSGLVGTRTIREAMHNLENLFGIYRSFDKMKAERIQLELGTLKVLMNGINEGIILVDEKKVVTHINHRAETLLKLIPGEMIGNVVIRNVSDEQFGTDLDLAVTQEKKVLEHKFKETEKGKIRYSMYPIKDKSDQIVRILMIFSEDTNQGDENE
jgi:Transcriptional regulator containing PAS, AAA-type ATPase, and DNA-binding domains